MRLEIPWRFIHFSAIFIHFFVPYHFLICVQPHFFTVADHVCACMSSRKRKRADDEKEAEEDTDPNDALVCRLCSKPFSRKDALERHILTHGERTRAHQC